MNLVFQKAERFLYQNARPLDLARWRFHFEGASAKEVLRCLAFYQNSDGGFGHGLEPDCWNPDSSPIQTWAATELLREIGWEDREHPLVQGILRYLESGRDFDGRTWANCVPGNNGYPHAPWWHWSKTEEITYNPTAALAGFYLAFGRKESGVYQTAQRVAKQAAQAFFAEQNPDPHTLACYIRLWEYCRTAGAEALIGGAQYLQKLSEDVKRAVCPDTERWGKEYVCMPSQLVDRADSPLCGSVRQLIAAQCEFVKQHQQDDGAWPVTWSWGSYPEQFAISANWWRGDFAVKNLLFLRAFSPNQAGENQN